MSIKFDARPALLPIDELLSDKDYILFICNTHFGNVCNEEEIKQIVEIVYKAYKRKGKSK